MITDDVAQLLSAGRHRWLITGVAGFIGSNLLEALLEGGQEVVGFDNFSTGYRRNLDEVIRPAPAEMRSRFRLIEADIRSREACEAAVEGVEFVLHQAALGSVPRSLADPLTSHDVNVTGTLNMLEAARRAGVRRFIYAASSSTYGDSAELPKHEERIGAPLSPYAGTKLADEIYAGIYGKCYGFLATGLRYFNVFGPRQDPDGAYAAVIPRWTAAMIKQDQVTINGDGKTSRDFCYVANAVQANIRAALASDQDQGEVYNVAVGERTSLGELFRLLRDSLAEYQIHYLREPRFAEFRAGDVRHSLADISKARRRLRYNPTHNVKEGIRQALPWYVQFFRNGSI